MILVILLGVIAIRALPMRIPMEDLIGVQGVNERILVSSDLEGIQYSIRLMQNVSTREIPDD